MAAEDHGLPVRELCDLNDPEEMFLWALLAQDDVNGAQVMVSIQHLRTISKRIYQVGGRLVADPVIKYRAPAVAPLTPFGDQGRFVPIDEPEPERDALGESLAQLKPHVLRAVVDRTREDHPEWWADGDNA